MDLSDNAPEVRDLPRTGYTVGSTPVRQYNLEYQPIKGITMNSTKDSGIGTTYLTVSSGPSSSNTSPESDKDLPTQNGKPVKHLSTGEIDATSTPAMTVKRGNEANFTPYASPSSRGKLQLDDMTIAGCQGTPVATLKRMKPESVSEVPTTMGEGQQPSLAEVTTVATEVAQPADGSKIRQRRIHTCEHCNKQFDRPSLLKRHTLTHTGERPFECRYCGKGFSTRSGVNTHERTHTGQRPYVCRICGRRFAAGSNLIFHKYTHTNTRRHPCSQCTKAFVTPGDLRKHVYTHTGEWPFRCNICSRGFATERTLKSHEMTHTGQKPFCCPICGKGYAQDSSMKTHMRTHQPRVQEHKAIKTDGSYVYATPNSHMDATYNPERQPSTNTISPAVTNSPVRSRIAQQPIFPHPTSIMPSLSDAHTLAIPTREPSRTNVDLLPNTSHRPSAFTQLQAIGQPMPYPTNLFYSQPINLLQAAAAQATTSYDDLILQQYRAYYTYYMTALQQQQEQAHQLQQHQSTPPAVPVDIASPPLQHASRNRETVGVTEQQQLITASTSTYQNSPAPMLPHLWPTYGDVLQGLSGKPIVIGQPGTSSFSSAFMRPAQHNMPFPQQLYPQTTSQSLIDRDTPVQPEPLDYSMRVLPKPDGE